jgi:hypothetical protein
MILPSIVEKHTIHGQHQEVIVKLENAVFQHISNRQTESDESTSGLHFRIADNPRTTSFMDTSAFVGTIPTERTVTSGLLMIQAQSPS